MKPVFDENGRLLPLWERSGKKKSKPKPQKIPSTIGKGTVPEKIVILLKNEPDPLSAKEVSEELGITLGHSQSALYKLTMRELVERTGSRRFWMYSYKERKG